MKRWIFFLILVSDAALAGHAVDWKKCQQADMYESTAPFDKQGNFRAECAPEILYSWRTEESLKAMVMGQRDGKGPVETNKMLFLAKTPLSSHSYGAIGMRIKLRKDVKFVFANREGNPPGEYKNYPNRNCRYYKETYPQDYDRLVLVSVIGLYHGFSEYVLCSDGPIESWSYGTPEQLVEEKKEYDYYKKHPAAKDHESLMPDETLTIDGKTDSCPDRKDCSLQALMKRLERAEELATKGKGKIFFMGDVPHDRASHFSNEKEFYYSLSAEDKAAVGLASPAAEKRQSDEGAR